MNRELAKALFMEPTARVVLEKLRASLRNAKNIQCEHGNWNHCPYMHGLANGLIMASAWAEGEGEPKFLESPDQWLKDIPTERRALADAVTTDAQLLMNITERVVRESDKTTG